MRYQDNLSTQQYGKTFWNKDNRIFYTFKNGWGDIETYIVVPETVPETVRNAVWSNLNEIYSYGMRDQASKIKQALFL